MAITKNTPVKEILAIGSVCSKCGHCCSFGSGFTLEEELRAIAKHLKIDKEKLKKDFFVEKNVFETIVHTPKLKTKDGMPFGNCIFLENKRCKIHEVKPLHCRVGNCNGDGEKISEWYTVNYLVDKKNPKSIRQWNIRVEVKPAILDGAKPEEIVGKKKLKEILDYKEMEKRIIFTEVMKYDNSKKRKNNRN